ncbi:MAG: AAA family ATPase [Actinophytocola sp.]|uniref:ATP-binding protein n=1 Tax=Actinophytocola sp. TaxID=1872138 RepID=UPI0013265334|nr:AAA family ATPase [Actinophytocola sp.]MPZ80187.1 AAA family ATPase [Actinophytocola sp.]
MATAELIGRDHPAGVLRAEIGRAAGSHGGLVLVTGEAGIGKTTLVTAGMETARRDGALVLSGSCWDSTAAPGYWPWVQVVRGLRRQATAEEWMAVQEAAGPPLAFLLGDTRGEQADGFQMYDAVTSALVAVAQRRPVVVVLDDLHWADPESVRLLEFVAQHTWFERLLLVGTYRDVEVEAADHPLAPLMLPLLARATTVTLTGLGEAEVGALIARTTGAEPAADLVTEVHLRTGGNPFFVEQTARLWHSGSALTTVAPGVRDAVRRRLSLLPTMVSTLLTDAAVLGREFHRQVLAAVVAAPVPHVDRLLAESIAARLVVALGDGRFAFAHDLVRETLYEALDEAEARSRHAAVVGALGRSPALSERIFPADRARHAYLAGAEIEPDVVVELLTAAARDARKRMAVEESAAHYRRALALVGRDDPRRARLSLDLGSQLYHFGPVGEAWNWLGEAAEVALRLDDTEMLPRVALTLHGVGSPDGRAELKARLLRAAHRRMVGTDQDGKSPDQLVGEVILQVVAMARSGNDDDALGFSLWTMHDTLWEPGHGAERLELCDELAAIGRRLDDAEMEQWATSLSWVALLELGDPRYHDRFIRFVALTEQRPEGSMVVGADIDQSIIAAMCGRFAESDAMFAKAMSVPQETDHPHMRHAVHHLRWASLQLQGRWDDLDELRLRALDVRYPFPELLEGITAAARGHRETALRCVAEADARDRPVPGPFRALWLRLLAQAASLTGDPSLGDRARSALAPHAGEWLVALYGCDIGGPADLWLAAVESALGNRDAAESSYAEALRSAETLGARPWVVEAKVGLAGVLSAAGDEARAAVLRDEASREAAELDIRHRAGLVPALSAPRNEFHYTGETWSLTMAGRTVHVPDAKGLRDLHVLLSSPGTEVSATRLLNPEGGQEVVAAARLSGDDVLDAGARAAYRRRLSTLDEMIDAATLRGDDEKAAAHDQEREALLDELRKATGLGVRQRRLGDEAERARKTVTARIRDTLRKLDDRHPELATHLRDSVSTGATCCYQPPSPTRWTL